MPFRNPILPGFNPDPSIIRVEDDYFLATSSFEYFPGIPIYTSKDLINWKRIGHVLTRPSQLDLRTCPASGGIYAPTLRCHDGRFYVTVTAIHKRGTPGSDMVPPRGFHVWSDDIWDQSSWSDPIYHDVLGIDQDLFWDDDGTVYLSYAVTEFTPFFRMYVNTLVIDIGTGRRKSPVVTIATWEHDNHVAEGPHIFKRDGYYYLITANGGTEVNHQEWVYRSEKGPFGPWIAGKKGVVNPMIFNKDHKEVQQTGHMDLVEGTGGQWWAVFLGVRPVERTGAGSDLSHLGRETFLAPVEWVDGWPIVNRRQPISLLGTGLDLMLPSTFTEQFAFSPEMDLGLAGWYNLRTPLKVEHDLESRPGSLALLGGPYDIRTDECITAFFQKQTAFEGEYGLTIDYPDPEDGHEAGATVWWSRAAFASVGVRGKGKGRELIYRSDEEPATFPIDQGILHIRIVVTTLRYTFFAQVGSAAEIEVGEYDSSNLVQPTEPKSLFTGTHFGLFAMGANKIGSMTSAYFSDIRWKGVRA